MRDLKFIWKFAIFTFFVAGFYHFIGIFYEVNDAPPYRHFVFVLINLFCIYGFYKRPKYFVFLFFLLVINQLDTHGGSLLRDWGDKGIINWIDLFVVILVPLFFAHLVMDWKSRFQ